jgi:sulfofructosephosphate aldolase
MRQRNSSQLDRLARPSGGFAMLAIDQREGLRAMLAQHEAGPVPDSRLTEFKLHVIDALTPYASAVLIDRELAWEQAIEAGVIAPDCALIAAADTLISGNGELVSEARIDDFVVPERVRDQGAVAMKLLVLWRPRSPADPRIAMVDEFIARCRRAGLVSIIEPVVRKPHDGGAWDRETAILAAAEELGHRGADIYKCEVPFYGAGPEREVRAACAAINRAVGSEWVVLSSGVQPDQFPQAVEWACREGASGFLAGRGVWSGAIGQADLRRALRQDSVPRLQRLCEVVDRAVAVERAA